METHIIPPTRRKILKTGGAAVLITAAAGTGWALTRAPKHARQPWQDAEQGFGDPRLDILAYAILAPNPHNMQPWQIQLDNDNGFTIFCDQSRLLPETDPPNRQITIGFGCFLELVRQAAAENGFRADITPFPEGEPHPLLDERPIASVKLVPDSNVQKDPLFGSVLTRRTNRAPFTDQRVDQSDMNKIIDASVDGVSAGGTNEDTQVASLRAFAVNAWEIEWSDSLARRESIDVTKIGKGEINENPWGVTLAGPFMEAVNKIGILTRKDMDIAGTTSYDQTLAFYNKACETSAAFVWTTTKTNTRLDQLNAGQAWVRMQMSANQHGIAFHPLSQALQEFPAMARPYAEIHDLLANEGETVQMFARIGYADAPPPAPRETLTAKLIDA